MGKFDGVLLASDFDDTLYDKHLQVPQRNRLALEYFMAQGGRFAVATGRAFEGMETRWICSSRRSKEFFDRFPMRRNAAPVVE